MSLLKVNRVLYCLLIVFNIYGAFIQNITGVSRQLFIAVFLCLLIVSLLLKYVLNGRIKINKYYMIILISELLISSLHIILFKNFGNEISMLLYFVVFFLIGVSSKKEDYELILKTVVVISITMSIEAIYYYFYVISRGWNTFNVRIFTSAPKEDYTFILTLSFVIAFAELMYRAYNYKKKIFLIAIMVVDAFVSVIVMQSKTVILVIMATVATAFFVCGKRIKQIIITSVVLGLTGFVLLLVLKPDLIPDYLVVFINKITGLMQARVDKLNTFNLYNGTYDQRSVIYMFALDLFGKNFFSGIGFFRFSMYSSLSPDPYINAVVQTESGIVGAFLEGGIIFGLIYIGIILAPGISAILCYKRNKNPNCIRIILISFSIFILSLNNDTSSVTFWLFASFNFAQTFLISKENAALAEIKNIIRKRLAI